MDTEELAEYKKQRKLLPSCSISGQDNTSDGMQKLWKYMFKSYDMDNDGKIQLGEFKALLKFDNNASCLHPNVVEEIMQRADLNKDHFITYDEFKRMMLAANLWDETPRLQRMVKFAAFLVVPKNEQATTVRRYVECQNYTTPPMFIFLISLIQIAIYIYYCVKLNKFSVNGPIPYDSVFVYNPNRKKELWRYVTYMFIHNGVLHIAVNVFAQLAFGIPLELIHKWWKVGLVYLAGVLSGSLAASIFHPNKYMGGASAGAYALIAAYQPNVIVHFKQLEYRWFRLAALIWFALVDVAVALYYRFVLRKRDSTSHAGHIGGALAGLLVSFLILRNVRDNPREERLRWIIATIYIAVMLIAILWNALYNGH